MERHDAKRMRALVRRRERRGLTWDELADESGIPTSTLQWWKRRLNEEAAAGSAEGFVELDVVETDSDGEPGLEVVLAPSGHCVRIRPGFSPELLHKVVQALLSC